MAPRILFSILLLLSVLFAPFWLSIILGLVGIFIFPIYWEAMVIFLISDFLFGTKQVRFWNLSYIGLLGSALALVLIEPLKKKLKFYNQ